MQTKVHSTYRVRSKIFLLQHTSVFLQTPPLIMIRGMVKSEVQKASDKEQSSAKY